MSETKPKRRRVLAIVAQFIGSHLDYLKDLSEHVEIMVAVTDERWKGTIRQAQEKGLRVTPIGRLSPKMVELRLRKILAAWHPDVIHTLFHYNEEMTIMAKRLVGQNTIVIHETRDPLTAMLSRTKLRPESDPYQLEREALQVSDGQIFVSQAMRKYCEETHSLNFSANSLVVPMCFCNKQQIAPASRKFSADDGRVHIVLDGTVSSDPNHGRYYVNIINRLVSLGLVVHSHFHESDGSSNQVYRDLSAQLGDYHYHETISFSKNTSYSKALSRYDLMGIFHELNAARHNESVLLETSMPAKAVSGWLSGGIPTVCFSHYKGIIEQVQEFGIGFVAESWDDIARITQDREAIDQATKACLAHRHRFTTEWSAERVATFYERLLTQSQIRDYSQCTIKKPLSRTA